MIKRTTISALTVLALLLPSVASAFEASAPPGYSLTSSEEIASGVRHVTFTSMGKDPHVAHAAFMPRGSGAAMRVTTATDGSAGARGPLVKTSEMCLRVACLVGVNGPMKERETHRSIGGVVQDGEIIRSPLAPERAVSQLMILADGAAEIGTMEWSAALIAGESVIPIAGVNVTRHPDGLVLYTPRFGPTTETGPDVFEIAFSSAEPVRLGRTVTAELNGALDAHGNMAIPLQGGVLSGHGRGADELRALWARVVDGTAPAAAAIRTTSALGVSQSLGGRPVLVRDGRKAPLTARDTARIDGRHPRTLAGRTSSGDLLIVTIDGRQAGYSDGVTLDEAADVMLGMGAVDAINLDGGGSSTFVVRGAVTNRPSDRLVGRGGHAAMVASPGPKDRVIASVEREVSAALVVVAAPSPAAAAVPRRASPKPSPKTLAPKPTADAPTPERHEGLAISPGHRGPPATRAAAIAFALWVAVAVSYGLIRRRPSGARPGS
jgi:exopolysaccharide biosynthesis protein